MLRHVDEMRLPRTRRVEGRLPRHREAIADDRDQDDRVERRRLHDPDRGAAEGVVHLQAEERGGVVPPHVLPDHRVCRWVAGQRGERRQVARRHLFARHDERDALRRLAAAQRVDR